MGNLRMPLFKQLDARILEEADDAAALSIEAREQQAAEVAGDLLDIERKEAALVWAGLAQACRLSTQ